MNWFILSLIGLFSIGIMSFLITVITKKGYPVSFVLLSLSLVLFIFYFTQTFVLSHYKPHFTLSVISIILLIGILSSVGNLALYQAATNAPNPGLAIAIVGMQSVVVSILAVIFFKNQLTPLQIAGVVLSIVAIFLINLGTKPT